MILRQLYDQQSGTFSYLLGDRRSGSAVIIDPVMEQAMRDFELLRELGLTLIYIFETGLYHDRVSGSGMLRELTGGENGTAVSILPYSHHRRSADSYTKDGDIFHFGANRIEVIDLPGPEGGWACYLVNGNDLFTGDTLLVRDCGSIRGKQAGPLFRGIVDKLFALHDECSVYPGRLSNGAISSTIGEEKLFNPMFQEMDEAQFIDNLDREDDTIKFFAEELIDTESIEEKARLAGLVTD